MHEDYSLTSNFKTPFLELFRTKISKGTFKFHYLRSMFHDLPQTIF